MHQRKSKKILSYFFLLIIVSSISNNSINILNLSKIQNIEISGLDPKDNQILLNKIKNLNVENIFAINKNEIVKLLNSNSLVELADRVTWADGQSTFRLFSREIESTHQGYSP